MKKDRFQPSYLYVIAVLLFIFAPVFVIIVFSFGKSPSLSFPIGGFTMKWYKELFANKLILTSIRNSLYVAFAVSVISGILGTLTSFALNKNKFRGRATLSTAYMIPLTIPGLILGVSLLSFFSFISFSLSLTTVAISHIVFSTPFVMLIMNSRLENMDFTVEEAAVDLGANPFQVFTKITFPLIRTSYFGAMLIAFALSFDEFVVTFFTIGVRSTIPVVIWGMMRLGLSPVVNAISTIVIMTSIILIFIAVKVFKVNIIT